MHAHWWRYRAEGNAHILLEYHGSRSEKGDGNNHQQLQKYFHGRLMRVRKTNVTTAGVHLNYAVAYHNTLYRHLLADDETTEHTILLPVTSLFLESLCDFIFPARPLDRRTAAKIDYTQSHVCLVPDYCCLPAHSPASDYRLIHHRHPVVMIEIKPKWGFIPKSPFIAEKNRLKSERCRYCMHQLWKLAQHKISRCSQFCPMDLFSADKIRVLRSIRALFRDPQNNLRVFINGHLVADDYDDPSSSRIAKLLRLNDENSSIDLFLANILCGNPILQRLRDYQRRLDRFDIEFVHAIYDKLTAEERQSIDQRHLSIPSETLKNMLIDGGGENYSSSDIPAADDKFNMFAEFLASVTLKDLSLLITLTTVDYDNNNIHHEIHPVDLDPKPFNRIPHYFDLDQRIISHYTNLVSSGLITHNPCI